MRNFLLAISLAALPAMAADVYTFTVPDAVGVSTLAGLTTGWGYSLHNESNSLWLVTTDLSAGTFQHATPDLLFDFPDVAPGATIIMPYNPVTGSGLYQILWDANTPAGFVNSGTFTLMAQWWNGDPAGTGAFVADAPIATQSYTGTITPEPATVVQIALPLLFFGIVGAWRRRSKSLASHAVIAGVLASSFLFFARGSAAQTVPTMTIEIHNNSSRYSLYPVLSTGAHIVDSWMQAAFGVHQADLADNPYPTPSTFRLYLNPTGVGIPPNGSITLTLPLYTQLVRSGQVNPKLPDQYIDWWNGGRISLYASLYSDGAPPKALTENYTNRPSQTLVTPILSAAVPTCPACQRQPEIFADNNGELPPNDPFQITEYTLGAINLTTDPYELDVKNVDYDVSYVDNAFLPAAIEPYNNPVVGWIGTIQDIDPFKAAIQKFLATPAYQGWPQYVDTQGETLLKIPSALHVMQDQAFLGPAPPWAPIEAMKSLWTHCTSGGTEPVCSNIRDVRDLFAANYTNYKNNYAGSFSGKCDQTKGPEPATLDDASMLAHVYGWGPFNSNCTADTNLLENTPGYEANNFARYQSVKAEFDDLNTTPEFDPYVQLIHGEQYLNAQYVYAYSVDDALGNMQTRGEGLIIAVGGTNGFPNPDPATSPIHVPFGGATADKVQFVKYGVCTETPDQIVNPNFRSFDLSANQLSSCTLSFLDNQTPANLYFFKIKSRPPYPSRPPDGQPIPAINKTMIDCNGNTQFITDTWCANIFGYTQPVVGQHKREDDYIPVAAPSQTPPPLNRPGPQPQISIQPGSVSRNGTRLQLQLTIDNTGPLKAASVTLGSIILRTLSGAGDARLVEPALPISVGDLEPRASTTITLTLEVPLTVNKLQLTENGTVDGGDPPLSQFSLGQVIFPNK